MNDTIKIFRTPAGWMAKFSDPSVREAMGSDTIPTAFTANADAETVKGAIQRLNPDSIVILS